LVSDADAEVPVNALFEQLFTLFASELVNGQYPAQYAYDYYSYSFYAPSEDTESGNVFTFTSPLSLLQPSPSFLLEQEEKSSSLFISFPLLGGSTKIGTVAINQNSVQRDDLNADMVMVMVQDPDLCLSSPCQFNVSIPHYQHIPFNTTYITEIIRVPCTTEV
jgi:hypothetical protein